jgi:hypothetical protein
MRKTIISARMGSHASRQNYSYLQQGIIARAEKFFYPTSSKANRSRNKVLLLDLRRFYKDYPSLASL